MSVTVIKEPFDAYDPCAEACCFCRAPTRFWYVPGGVENMKSRDNNEVACCPDCAKNADVKDMPTKAQWFRRERIAYHGR